jgi:hypothetical protein
LRFLNARMDTAKSSHRCAVGRIWRVLLIDRGFLLDSQHSPNNFRLFMAKEPGALTYMERIFPATVFPTNFEGSC